MAIISKKVKKVARYALSALLLAGMVCVTGFLSFTGMLVFNSSLYLAVTAFFLAGGIEGEVYAQNINASLLTIFTGDYWEDLAHQELLKKLIHDNPSNSFLKECRELQEYITRLEAAHDHSQALELKNAKRSLKYKIRYFKNFMQSVMSQEDTAQNPTRDPFHQELQAAFKVTLEKEKQPSDTAGIRQAILKTQQQIGRKILLSRLAWILNIGAGISCFFVGLEVAQTSMAALGLTLSGAALSASVFGLAIVGAIGYMMLIHNTISNMIKDDTLRSWVAATRDFFKRRTKETSLRYALRTISGSVGITILVGLAIFATVATAGTWWHAAKAGAKLIPWLANAANPLRAIAVSIMGFTQLLFNIWNSLKSVEDLIKISLRKIWLHLKKNISEYRHKENLLQFLNPFRLLILLITLPFKFLVFIGHLLSMGLMGDQLDKVPPLATTLLATSNEALQDGHYFLPEEEACSSHGHSHKDHEHGHNHEQPHENHQEHEHEHSHQHIDLVGKFLKYVVLAPLYLLAALWDWVCSQKNCKEPPLSIGMALKKAFFGFSRPSIAIPKPVLSAGSEKYETEKRLEKIIVLVPRDKKAAITTLVNKHIKTPNTVTVESYRTLLQNQKSAQTIFDNVCYVAKNSFFFKPSEPRQQDPINVFKAAPNA
jgi:hypothetical protein